MCVLEIEKEQMLSQDALQLNILLMPKQKKNEVSFPTDKCWWGFTLRRVKYQDFFESTLYSGLDSSDEKSYLIQQQAVKEILV